MVVVSGGGEVAILVTTVAAALGYGTTVCEPESLAGRWASAGTIFIGLDSAAEVAALELARRERVYSVGADTGAAALWSVPLGAEVIVLPQGRGWLSSVLADRVVPARWSRCSVAPAGSEPRRWPRLWRRAADGVGRWRWWTPTGWVVALTCWSGRRANPAGGGRDSRLRTACWVICASSCRWSTE